MPRPRPLRPDELARTLIGRFEKKPGGQPGIADKLRQIATKLGARPYRVMLCWYRSTGDEVGEGDLVLVRELEILPTPTVVDVVNVSRLPFPPGQLPEGTLKVDEVSAGMAEDTLLGRMQPGGGPLPEPYQFFYEVFEDGRSGAPGLRQRYRLYGQPSRNATNVCWSLMLQRASGDRLRDGRLVNDPVRFEET